MDAKYLLLLTLIVLVLIQDLGVDAKKKKKKKKKSSSSESSESGSGSSSASGSAEGEGRVINRRLVPGACGLTYDLEALGGGVEVKLGPQRNCDIYFVGSPTCIPELHFKSMKFNGGGGAECGANYLEVADGWGGTYRACGDKQMQEAAGGLRASAGARDLFVTLQGHKGAKVDCIITCADPSAAAPPDLLARNVKKRKVENRCVCGIQNQDDRIVGGEDAKKFEFPWQAAIVGVGTRSPNCGAALINDRFILTATHCFWFSNTTADQVEILLHAHVLDFTLNADWNKEATLGQLGSIKGSGWNQQQTTDESERTLRLQVEQVIMHPLFTDKYDYDVCLLKLKKPLDLSTIEATPICLPPKGDRRDFLGKKPKVVGWGMPDEIAGSTTRLLQKLDVPVISNADCAAMMEFDLPERMLCAGYQEGKMDACTGDSGGPLSLKNDKNQYTQIGVVSWGEGCARENRPGIYARVTDMSDWIHYHTNKEKAIWCRESMDDKNSE